jgi:predicted NBD/HSP70 family sugar kinase
MLALGIDLADAVALGVAVDDAGKVLRQARGAGSPSGISMLLAELAAGHRPGAVGVAADGEDAGIAVMDGWPLPRACTPGAAAVVAESWVGAARGARNVLCLVVGDRVTAGLLLNGEPWLGAHGAAGAAAWFALNPVERQDYRKFGNLAAEVSHDGIARRLAWRVQAGDESMVIERAGSLDAITAAQVFEGARRGDGVAISVTRETAKYIGMAIANMASLLDPDIIVLGGAVADARDLLLEPIRQEYARRLPPGLAQKLAFAISDLGEYAVATGAARLAMVAAS